MQKNRPHRKSETRIQPPAKQNRADPPPKLDEKIYEKKLGELQVELVKLQE